MRKSIVSYLSALALVAVVGATALPTFGGAKRIDFEHHFVSTNYINYVAERTEPPMYDRTEGIYYNGAVPVSLSLLQPFHSENSLYDDLTDLDDKRIAEMDRAGVDVAVLSSTVQADELPPEDALRIVKLSNDDIYQATLRHPDRFMGAALLPSLQPEAACAELERCAKELGFKYWHTYSTIPDPDKKAHQIWEPEFEPILAKAAELGVCIYIHPEYPLDADYWDSGECYAGAGFSYGQDMMQVVTHLIMNGTFDKYPNLRIILGHMGEYLPYVLDRMNYHLAVYTGGNDPVNVTCQQSLYHYVLTNANFVITTSGVADTNAFQCSKEVLGADRICFGSDWPYEDYAEMSGFINKCDLTDAERDGVWSDNAQMYILHATAKVATEAFPNEPYMSWSLRQRYTADDSWRAVPFNTVSNRYEAVSNGEVQVVYTIPAGSGLTFMDGSKEKTFALKYADGAFAPDPAITSADLQTKGTKHYDLEHHFYVPEFFEYMESRTIPPRFIPGDPKASEPLERFGKFDIGQKTFAYYSDEQIERLVDFTEKRIAAMDAAGVDVAVLSSGMMIEALPREKAIELAKLSNDRVYEMSTNFPGRILGTATLPTVWVDDATNELERCVKELGFKYWHTHDHYVTEDGQTNYLWEAKFAPLLAKANELGLAIYIHPDYQSQTRYDYGPGFMGAMLGFSQGVMATATKFIIKGKLDEYPNIKLIIGHTGEYMPYVLERMDNRLISIMVPDPEVTCKKSFSEYFQEGRIFVTTSGNRFEPALQCTKRAIGIDRIAYGSDWPYEGMDIMTEFIDGAKLTDEERNMIYGGTATERIFKK